MKGFVKVASAIPKVKVADCRYNIVEINRLIQEAAHLDIISIVGLPICSWPSTAECGRSYTARPYPGLGSQKLPSQL